MQHRATYLSSRCKFVEQRQNVLHSAQAADDGKAKDVLTAGRAGNEVCRFGIVRC